MTMPEDEFNERVAWLIETIDRLTTKSHEFKREVEENAIDPHLGASAIQAITDQVLLFEQALDDLRGRFLGSASGGGKH